MKSFDEKLETLYLPPKFSQTKLLNRIGRRSLHSQRNSFTSQIFEGKRERLESGDFLPVPRTKISRLENNEEYQFVLRDRLRKYSEISRQAVPPIQEIVEETTYDMKPPENKEEEENGLEQEDSETTREVEKTEEIMEKETPKNDLIIKLVLPPSLPKPIEKSEVVPNSGGLLGIDKSELSREDKTANIIFNFIKSRIKSKIHKIKTYWGKTSLLVPNVYRMVRDDEENRINFIEFQDYSKKELLVQSNGLRFKPKEKKGDLKKKQAMRKVSKSMAYEESLNNSVNCK